MEDRKERAIKMREELDRMRIDAKNFLQIDNYERARVLLNRCKDLETQISTLERFKDDEEFRLHLITVMSNGYR
jgi:uncharacterized protein YjcR